VKKLFSLILISLILFAALPLLAEAAGTIALSTASARVGDTVTVTGVNNPDTWVAVKAVDSLGNILVFDAVKTDNNGAYSFSFTVPESVSGTIRITAGYGSNVASNPLNIEQPPPTPPPVRSEHTGAFIGSHGSQLSYNATVVKIGIPKTTLPVNTNANTASAVIELGTTLAKDILDNPGMAILTVPSIPGVNCYTSKIPAGVLSDSQGESFLIFSTSLGSITIPSGMLAGMPETQGETAAITISQGDKFGLPEDVKAAIGDRPIIQLTLTLDGTQMEWNNPDSPVKISIPYTPTAVELANPESIVVWYIDGSGRAVCVTNGRYDPNTGTVTFTTTHFSHYAVSYKQVSFQDVARDAWYARAVSFIAARDITAGTGGGNFNPDDKLTRGQFIVMLMRAYGIEPDTNPKDNFADAGNTWYTGYLAAAKRLGISAGVGSNMFAPEKEVTRQEMFTLLYNALKAIGQLPGGDFGKTLSSFDDAGEIAPWAKEAMKLLVETGTISGRGGKLAPADTATRAQMAQMLYSLLSK